MLDLLLPTGLGALPPGLTECADTLAQVAAALLAKVLTTALTMLRLGTPSLACAQTKTSLQAHRMDCSVAVRCPVEFRRIT